MHYAVHLRALAACFKAASSADCLRIRISDGLQSMEGEEANMVVIPAWQRDNKLDAGISKLCRVLVDTLAHLESNADLREYTADIAQQLESMSAE